MARKQQDPRWHDLLLVLFVGFAFGVIGTTMLFYATFSQRFANLF